MNPEPDAFKRPIFAFREHVVTAETYLTLPALHAVHALTGGRGGKRGAEVLGDGELGVAVGRTGGDARVHRHDRPAHVVDDLGVAHHRLVGVFVAAAARGVSDAQVARLDELLERHNATLPRLQEFILPGGSRAAAIAHIARTVCRRAERAVVSLGAEETVRPACRQYLNRLSDLLFVLSRVLNRADGGSDVLWQQGRNKPG